MFTLRICFVCLEILAGIKKCNRYANNSLSCSCVIFFRRGQLSDCICFVYLEDVTENLLVCKVICVILKPGHDTSVCFTGNLRYFLGSKFEKGGQEGIVDKAINHLTNDCQSL